MDRLNKNLHVILKFSKRSKTPGITLRNMPFSEGNQLFVDDFQKMNFIFWMKQMLVCFNLQSNGTGTGS